jgi:site-specific recombinase XerD
MKNMTHNLKPTSTTTFQSYLESKDLSLNTIQAYQGDLQRFSVWFSQTNGQQLSPETITATDVREYRQYMILHRSSSATINRKLAALRTYAEWSGIQINVRGIEEQSAGPRWLERRAVRELNRVLEQQLYAAKTKPRKYLVVRDQAIIMVLLNTGLRIGELCALQSEDIELSERKGSLIVRCGKGGKSRIIPLNLTARSALHAWMDISGQCSETIFDVNTRTIQRMIEKLSTRIGTEVTAHMLRHTFAKNLMDSGVSIEKVAALLGHSNLNTTRRYITPSVQDLENAVNVLD